MTINGELAYVFFFTETTCTFMENKRVAKGISKANEDLYLACKRRERAFLVLRHFCT